MDPAPQGSGQLRMDAVPLQIDLIIAWARRLLRVTERRGEVTRVQGTDHRHDGDMAEIPMPFVGVGEGEDLRVLILIARTTAELRDGTELHHRVRQSRTGE